MPLSLSAEKLLEITGAVVGAGFDRSRQITGVSFDSRLTKPGELFLALKGEAGAHGHSFLKAALEKGAAVCLVEDQSLLDGPGGEQFAFVGDTLSAFWAIASWWRNQLSAPILAITGSVGKTTTKELTRALLVATGQPGTASSKSFNNHIGAPFTLCQISTTDRWAVLELGMNHAGELRELSKLVQPDVAVITSVEPVHLEFFDSVYAIAEAKLEIAEGLKKGGVLLLNGDNQTLLAASKERASTGCSVAYFGKATNAIVRVESVQSQGLDGALVALNCRGTNIELKSPLPGAHNASNIAAAVAAVTALFPQLEADTLDKTFSKFQSPAMRLDAKTIGNLTIIDDSYNANPTAMRAALQILVDARKPGDKVGAILGEMKELGETAADLHREIGAVVSELGIDCLIAVGNHSQDYLAGIFSKHTRGLEAQTPEFAATLAQAQCDISIWLVKASRGARLDLCVRKLLDVIGPAVSSM